MNEATLLSNIKTRLIAQTWTGSSNVVFPTGSVKIVPSIPDAIQSALDTMRSPMCLVSSGTAESDPVHGEEPDFIRFTFDCALIAIVAGDSIGENVYIGGNKIGGSTQSEGRGIVELSQELYNAVGKLNSLEGITLQIRQKGEQGAAYKSPLWIAYRVYTLEGFGTAT